MAPKPTHGLSQTPEYIVWRGIISRCRDASCKSFKDYGGRGIAVCDRWAADVRNFLADMGPRPSSRHTIDRTDNDGNYEPGNCEWADRTRQANNRRSTRYVEYRGEKMSLADAIRMAGSVVSPARVGKRLALGLSLEQSIETPARSAASGIKGVHVDRGGRRICASFTVDGKKISLGTFKSTAAARAAYEEARLRAKPNRLLHVREAGK